MAANLSFVRLAIGACLIAPIQLPSQIQTNIPAGYTNLARIAAHFAKMLDEDKLPGLKTSEHGKANAYPLTPDLQKEWRAEELLGDEMLADVASCKEAYVMAIETEKTEKFLRYFFCVENGKVKLVSAYHFPNGRWLRLAVKEKGPEPKIPQ